MSLRVRYAPSPTGLHHIGGARTALFAYLLARSSGGTFILRIEDTDRARFDPAALEDIYDTLGWLGLRWDEGPKVGGPHGPYVQSERVERHRAVAERLVDTGRAYRCYCDPARLARVREAGSGYDRRCRNLSAAERRHHEDRGTPSVVRFKVPLDGATRYEDDLLGSIERRNSDINPDPVLLKSDGYPTYHLAAITDDHDMRVSHILRAQEWVSSAPLHVLIFRACGWEPPRYAHLPVVNGPDGKKLSKRHGAMSVAEFRDQGYLPEALVNYMALLGWSLDGERELFTLRELEQAFSLERLHASPAVFDADKLRWMNGNYIRALPPEELAATRSRRTGGSRPGLTAWYARVRAPNQGDESGLTTLFFRAEQIERFLPITPRPGTSARWSNSRLGAQAESAARPGEPGSELHDSRAPSAGGAGRPGTMRRWVSASASPRS